MNLDVVIIMLRPTTAIEMKQVLFQRLLCVLEGLMTLATLLKNLHQRMKEKYPKKFASKKV